MVNLFRKQNIMTLVVVPALPLMLGGTIYVLWRSTSLLMFRWFDLAGLMPAIHKARSVAACAHSHLPGWFLYSVPDAAWASCGILLFAAIWSGSSYPVRHFWIWLAPSLAIGGELAQLFHLVPGTFDLTDLATCTLMSAVSIAVTNRFGLYGIRPR